MPDSNHLKHFKIARRKFQTELEHMGDVLKDTIIDTEHIDSISTPNIPQRQITIGNTPGTFDVTVDGSASFTIPLETPPGRAGMQPDLALVYNSSGGNGPLGVGWSLKGLSQINRCR